MRVHRPPPRNEPGKEFDENAAAAQAPGDGSGCARNATFAADGAESRPGDQAAVLDSAELRVDCGPDSTVLPDPTETWICFGLASARLPSSMVSRPAS